MRLSNHPSPRPARGRLCSLPDRLTGCHGVEVHDDRVMFLWLADLAVNGLLAKDRRKAEREDRRYQRRREKTLRQAIDGPAGRREPKTEPDENAVSDEAKEEARQRLAEALERAGVGG